MSSHESSGYKKSDSYLISIIFYLVTKRIDKYIRLTYVSCRNSLSQRGTHKTELLSVTHVIGTQPPKAGF